ncbi:MAG: hypothetical protein PF518_01060 [Spirochaetaceae bacterium]|jgi:DNA-binding Lrp family transcriptional regulator|nr:hypothetical protein [Spirochaetaceae bacterium]
MNELVEIEKLILDEIQKDIPLVSKPFLVMGNSLGLTEKNVLSTIQDLLDRGFIRDISAIYNARGLGYKSTLVALSSEEPDKTAAAINRHPGVSHNYYREHDFNIWFTLTIPEDKDFKRIIEGILKNESYNNFRVLPSLRTFKIGVNFRFSGEIKKKGINKYSSDVVQVDFDKNLIRSLQRSFPLVPSPWLEIARELEISENELLKEVEILKKSKVIKRISGVLRHRKAGYGANGMACFQLKEEQIEEAGIKAAHFNAVSHCYQRPVYPDWPYSLFAMTHGKTKEDCDAVINEISNEIGAEKSLTLYSTKEYKKERVKYFI